MQASKVALPVPSHQGRRESLNSDRVQEEMPDRQILFDCWNYKTICIVNKHKKVSYYG